ESVFGPKTGPKTVRGTFCLLASENVGAPCCSLSPGVPCPHPEHPGGRLAPLSPRARGLYSAPGQSSPVNPNRAHFPLCSPPMGPSRTPPAAVLSPALAAAARPAQPPKEAEAAYAEGVRHVNAREYKEAIGPLERALSLAPDNAYRVKVYRALVPAYRTLPGS